jgi:tetratricopeptide (TPR) repeat protein
VKYGDRHRNSRKPGDAFLFRRISIHQIESERSERRERLYCCETGRVLSRFFAVIVDLRTMCYRAKPMKECPQCGNSFPDTFEFCPADGSPMGGEERQISKEPAQIRIKTLMLAFGILVLCSVIAFAAAFFYQYWKPKYGSLTVKTTPPGAFVFIDGKLRGASPITISDLRSGGHQLKGTKEGYKDLNQQVTVMPYATENLHWSLEPIVPQLSNEQLAEVESWRKKLETAQKENILFPPPDDYNVLYFADKILAIDPANSYAIEAKSRLGDSVRRLAELAYAREDWLESEKQYKNLSLLFPNDISIGERLADVSAKLDASVKDREQQIQDWKTKAEAALKAGSLVPPDKDNALDAIRSIQRLDRNNSYVREAFSHLKELLQTRGDTKINASDWQGARNDFKLMLLYFPEDTYSKGRLAMVESKLEEIAQLEQQRRDRDRAEQESRKNIAEKRQTALSSFRSGSYQKSISEWQEYLKFEPNSDESHFYIGASYQNLKQLDNAILAFEKCISLNPNNALAHLNLGILYDYHRNNFRQAEEHLRRAKELGGAEKYTPERLQAMIQDIQDRASAKSLVKTLFQVEHKHTFSSCRGTLKFTEDGIEFKTAETDHSFYESYKRLRAFDLKGSDLTLKTHNNKKYNLHFLNPGDAARVRAWNSTERLIQIGIQPN